MRTSQNGDNARTSSSTAADTPTATTRPTGRSRSRSVTRIAPEIQSEIAAAISSPEGFTTPARKNTIGVAAIATPAISRRLRE